MDALITEAKNGDKEAFVRLIRMNKQSLYKTAWIYLRDEQDIADALQNTILSCYENIQSARTFYAKRTMQQNWMILQKVYIVKN